jgi:hypothetical protein
LRLKTLQFQFEENERTAEKGGYAESFRIKIVVPFWMILFLNGYFLLR